MRLSEGASASLLVLHEVVVVVCFCMYEYAYAWGMKHFLGLQGSLADQRACMKHLLM